VDTQKIIDSIQRNPAAAGVLGGLAGSLLGSVLTGGKSRGRGLLKIGGLAAVGYVAYQAWQRHQSQQQGQPVAQPAAPIPKQLPASIPGAFDLNHVTNSAAALRVVHAMVVAAKADGVIDDSERDRIAQRVEQAGVAAADRNAVSKLFTEALDLDSVVGGVNEPELAAEIYAGSMMAVHPANRAERAYLDMLAARLNLEPGLVAELDRGVSAALPASA